MSEKIRLILFPPGIEEYKEDFNRKNAKALSFLLFSGALLSLLFFIVISFFIVLINLLRFFVLPLLGSVIVLSIVNLALSFVLQSIPFVFIISVSILIYHIFYRFYFSSLPSGPDSSDPGCVGTCPDPSRCRRAFVYCG